MKFRSLWKNSIVNLDLVTEIRYDPSSQTYSVYVVGNTDPIVTVNSSPKDFNYTASWIQNDQLDSLLEVTDM